MPTNLDETFLTNMEQLATTSEDMHQQHVSGAGGTWSRPPIAAAGWSGDLFDSEGLALAFDRSMLAEQYQKAIADSVIDDSDEDAPSQERGTLADIAALKIQTGRLEQREQAYRARHATPIVAACHAAARRKGHGAGTDGIFGVLVNHVVNVINHGR